MAWTTITRAQHARDHLRQASDLSEAEWALIAPALPLPSGRGRPRTTDLRAVVNALLYILSTGCQWRAPPPGAVPPRPPPPRHLYRRRREGPAARRNPQPVRRGRPAAGR